MTDAITPRLVRVTEYAPSRDTARLGLASTSAPSALSLLFGSLKNGGSFGMIAPRAIAHSS
jgi:hypothetical protein